MSRQDWILLLTLSLLWGGSFLFVELALMGLPPLSVVWGRVALAALILGGIVRGGVPRRAWAAVAVMGVLNNVVPFTLFAFAQGRIGGGTAAMVNATTPLWTLLVAHLATRDEPLTAARIAGLVLGFAGVAAMAGGTVAGDRWAIVACLGAAVSYGFAAVWGRRFKALGVTPMQTAFGQVSCSSLVLLPVWLLVDQPWGMSFPGWGPLAAVLAIASLSTALAYLIFFRILASAGAVNLSLVTFLIPASAVGLGVLVLDEPLLARHLTGFGLIACGLVAIDGRVGRWWIKRQAAR